VVGGRVEQLFRVVQRAEELLAEIDPQEPYTLAFIGSRLAEEFRGPSAEKMTGRDVRHDLQLLVEDLSGAAALPVEAVGERVLSIRELARELHVSTKTISRWRRQGLVSRRFIFDDRKQVGFLQSSVERFIAHNSDRVHRGARFSQMTPAERSLIVDRARQLAAAGAWPAEITKELSRSTGRSLETIRYTLKRFDREHPQTAIFPHHQGMMPLDTKRKIYQYYQRGEPVDSLARRFCRTKSSVYRIIAQMRARRILDLPLEYVADPHFELFERDKHAEKEVLKPLPLAEKAAATAKAPPGLPPYLASLYEVPLLTREQEAHLFRKMNYLKYKATGLRRQLNPARPKKSLLKQIEEFYDETVTIKNRIIRANLRLVVSIAKRHVGPAQSFFELVSDGNVSLMRAVDRFDFSLQNKFSTYASWAIMKNFARSIPEGLRYRDRFRTSHTELFPSTEDARTDQHELEARQTQRRRVVERILRGLDKREQEIITSRFGLRHGQEPLTLKQVGAVMGVTKERIRQIEARALNKLRAVAVAEKLPPVE
jgi:RNA polymerase primary sigma factor/RNA polymerase sigma factor